MNGGCWKKFQFRRTFRLLNERQYVRWLKPSNGEFQAFRCETRMKFMGQFVGESSDYWCCCCHCHCWCVCYHFRYYCCQHGCQLFQYFVSRSIPFPFWGERTESAAVPITANERVGKWNLMMCNDYNPCSIIDGHIHNTHIHRLQKITGEIIQLMWFDEARISLALNFIQSYTRHKHTEREREMMGIPIGKI